MNDFIVNFLFFKLFLYIAAITLYRLVKKSIDRCFLSQKTETMHVE